jgi:hypothetical protein
VRRLHRKLRQKEEQVRGLEQRVRMGQEQLVAVLAERDRLDAGAPSLRAPGTSRSTRHSPARTASPAGSEGSTHWAGAGGAGAACSADSSDACGIRLRPRSAPRGRTAGMPASTGSCVMVPIGGAQAGRLTQPAMGARGSSILDAPGGERFAEGGAGGRRMPGELAGRAGKWWGAGVAPLPQRGRPATSDSLTMRSSSPASVGSRPDWR